MAELIASGTTEANTIRLGEIYTTSGGLVVRETWHTLPDHLAKDPAA
jgi:hypothetical protein